MDVVKMLRSYAKDMRPSGLGGGGYALAANNHKLLDNAADEIERLRCELETALYRFRFIKEGGEAGERALRLAIPDIEHALSIES